MRLRLSALLLLCALLPAAATEIANGQTALINLGADDEARLFYQGKELPLLQHPADPEQRIALIPVGYRTAPGTKQLHRLSPAGDEVIPFTIVDGGYPSETLHVQPSKVKPDPEQQKRVSKEYREAMAIYRRATPQRYWSTPFALPMESNITSVFGTARLFNGSLKSFHSGTDFRAKPGTPVDAVNDGVVVLAKERYYAGNSVLVDHGEGLYSCYYHLSRIDVKVGDRVIKGEQVGLSGSTGRVTGPHLHFAVMLQGIQVDPMQLLSTLNGLFQETKTARLDTSRASDAE
ncbi:peptidoglycan metallopeptidase Pgp3 [Thiomicrolovo sp. ZZH C-3]